MIPCLVEDHYKLYGNRFYFFSLLSLKEWRVMSASHSPSGMTGKSTSLCHVLRLRQKTNHSVLTVR